MHKIECNRGIGVLGMLQIIFVVLKCIGAINWSWGIVLIPAWIKIATFVLCFVLMAIQEHLFWK